jgi:L-ascorbate metabolism protein UlaG (beta-lactamase superfamily)
MLLDRPVGRFELADVRIIGVADKHIHDTRHSLYDWARLTEKRTGLTLAPPNNPRSFDNSLVLVETGGLRILHWGDNRPDPPLSVWGTLGESDVVLLPVDGSQHILSYGQAGSIAERLGARVIVPHHYFIWNLTQRHSTLLPVDEWVDRHEHVIRTQSATYKLVPNQVKTMPPTILYFSENVAFEPDP